MSGDAAMQQCGPAHRFLSLTGPGADIRVFGLDFHEPVVRQYDLGLVLMANCRSFVRDSCRFQNHVSQDDNPCTS